MRGERSVVDIVSDILCALQDVVRAEMRLAKAEVANELGRAKSLALGPGIAVLAGACPVLVLLLAAMYALTSRVRARLSGADRGSSGKQTLIGGERCHEF